MNILLDAMGGDNAPDANIKGAIIYNCYSKGSNISFLSNYREYILTWVMKPFGSVFRKAWKKYKIS